MEDIREAWENYRKANGIKENKGYDSDSGKRLFFESNESNIYSHEINV